MLEVVGQLLCLHVIDEQGALLSLAGGAADGTYLLSVAVHASFQILDDGHFSDLAVQHLLKSGLL